MVTPAQRAIRNRQVAKRRLKQRAGANARVARAARPKILVPAANLRNNLRLSSGFRNSIVGDSVDLIKSADGGYDAYFVDRGTSGPALVLQSANGTITPTPESAEDIAADIRQIHGVAPDAAVPDTVVMRITPGDEANARIAMQHLVDTLNADADPADVRPPLIAVEGAADPTDPNVVAMVFRLERRAPNQAGILANQAQANAAVQPAPGQPWVPVRDPADLATDVAPVDLMTPADFAAATKRRGSRTREYEQLASALDSYHQGIDSFRRDAQALRQRIVRNGEVRQGVVIALTEAEAALRATTKLRGQLLWLHYEAVAEHAELRDSLTAVGDDAAEIARLQSLVDAADAKVTGIETQLAADNPNGASPARIARLQQSTVRRRADLATADATIDGQIGESHALMRQHQRILDVRGRLLLTDAQAYLDSKTLDATNDRQRTAHQLIAQISDPAQHMQRLKEVTREIVSTEFRHGLAHATKKLNTATASDVFSVTTVGTIGDSGTRDGYAKRTLIEGDRGNDTTANLDVAPKGSQITAPTNLIARQVISSRIAKGLGLNVIADEVFSTDTDGRTIGITARAPGRQAMQHLGEQTHADPDNGKMLSIEAEGYARFDLTNPGVQKGLSDLKILDAIIGQMDRHLGNIFIDDQAGTVTGIDNDMALNRGDNPGEASINTLAYFSNAPGPRLENEPRLQFRATQVDAGTAAKVLAMTDAQLEALIRGRSDDPEQLGDAEVANAKARLQAVQFRIRQLANEPFPKGIITTWTQATHDQAIVDGTSQGQYGTEEHNYLARIHRRYAEAATAANPWQSQIP